MKKVELIIVVTVCVKVTKYVYTLKKDLFGCFRERRTRRWQCNRFERGRRN